MAGRDAARERCGTSTMTSSFTGRRGNIPNAISRKMAMARQFINRIYVVLWHAKELTDLYLGGNPNVVNLIVLGLFLVFAIWIAEMVLVLAA
jgi:hypothetical protein